MYDFIILTAAITRPALHRQVLPPTLQFLDGLPVKWLINVDDIDNGASVQETVDNFNRLFSRADHIDAEFLYADGQSCFFAAARRLAGRAHGLLAECQTGVLWLEDDWRITPKTPLTRCLNQYRVKYGKGKFGNRLRPCPGSLKQKQAIIETKGYDEQAWWYVSLAPKAKVSFNPSIWSKSLFKECFYLPLMQVEEGRVKDPEDLCCKPLNEADRYQRLTVLADPLFQDVGHRWIAALDLKKWEKNPASLAAQGVAGYSKKTRLPAMAQAALAGFFLMPDVLLPSPLKWLVRTSQDNGKLKARLPGVPWFSFEVLVAEDLSTEIYLVRMHPWAETSAFMRTPATVCWRFDRASGLPERVDVTFAKKNWRCSGAYSKTWPLCALWVVPIQSLLGLGLYVISFLKLMRGLKT